jgi:hypothetical protein
VGFHVPIPETPEWVSWEWNVTNAVLVVSCERCKTLVALYTTVLCADPWMLTRVVDEHRRCE